MRAVAHWIRAHVPVIAGAIATLLLILDDNDFAYDERSSWVKVIPLVFAWFVEFFTTKSGSVGISNVFSAKTEGDALPVGGGGGDV